MEKHEDIFLGQEFMYDPMKCPECLAIYTATSVPTTDQPSLTVIFCP